MMWPHERPEAHFTSHRLLLEHKILNVCNYWLDCEQLCKCGPWGDMLCHLLTWSKFSHASKIGDKYYVRVYGFIWNGWSCHMNTNFLIEGEGGGGMRKWSTHKYLKKEALIRWTYPNPTLDLIWHLDLSCMWLGVDLSKNIKKTCVKMRLTMCSTYDNHSRFNCQHNWGDLYNQRIYKQA